MAPYAANEGKPKGGSPQDDCSSSNAIKVRTRFTRHCAPRRWLWSYEKIGLSAIPSKVLLIAYFFNLPVTVVLSIYDDVHPDEILTVLFWHSRGVWQQRIYKDEDVCYEGMRLKIGRPKPGGNSDKLAMTIACGFQNVNLDDLFKSAHFRKYLFLGAQPNKLLRIIFAFAL